MLIDWLEASTSSGRKEILNNLRTQRMARQLNLGAKFSCSCDTLDKLTCFELPSLMDPDKCEVGAIYGDAPWHNLKFPASLEFAGLLVTDANGYDTSFERETNPLPFAGQTIGSRYDMGKCVTYDGLLIAKTQAGAEFGLSYYSELLKDLGECGKFTIWSATKCPKSDASTQEIKDTIRYIPNTYATSGPKVVEKFSTNCGCCGPGDCGKGAEYISIQFTLCSEQEYIYTLPDPCMDDEKFDKNNCACPVLWTKAKYKYKKTKTKEPRKIYQLQLRSDASVCRIGGWEWEETQLAGGTGVVEILQPEEGDVTASDSTTTEDCKIQRSISAKYDCSAGSGQIAFFTDSWANPNWEKDPTGIPCDVQISTYWSYDPGDLVVTPDDPSTPDTNEASTSGTAPSWTSGSGGGGDGCCKASIQWTSATAGVIVPIADPDDEWSVPYDPSFILPDGKCDWPPSACDLKIISAPCEEDGVNVEDCKDKRECPIIIDTANDVWELVNKPEPEDTQILVIDPSTSQGTGTQGGTSSNNNLGSLPPVRETCTASYYTDRAVLAWNSAYRNTMGAAHKTLPPGTHVWVEYQGKVVEVVIDDRGPYIAGRCIDLLENSFSQLAPLSAGVLNDVKLMWW